MGVFQSNRSSRGLFRGFKADCCSGKHGWPTFLLEHCPLPVFRNISSLQVKLASVSVLSKDSRHLFQITLAFTSAATLQVTQRCVRFSGSPADGAPRESCFHRLYGLYATNSWIAASDNQPTNALAGMVKIQAQRMFLAKPQRTALKR
jgi:hypothetical protein